MRDRNAKDDTSVDLHDHPVILWKRIVAVGVLSLLHAMTFADRFCVAGTLGKLTSFYGIDDSDAGLIQTLYLAASVVGAPFAGYFGDRFNRRYLLIFGVAMWILLMISSSFIPGNMFWLFMVLRCFDGFSENFVYACAPSIIADYFAGKYRSYAFMVFFYAINVGAAFGVMLGSVIATATQWQWALRFVPLLTIVGWVGLVLFVEEPPRGASENKHVSTNNNYFADLLYLLKIPTFVMLSIGQAAVNITAGAQGWWNALIVYHSMYRNETHSAVDSVFHHESYGLVNTIGGFVGIVSSVAGVSFVVFWSEQWKSGNGIFRRIKTMRAPALVIAICLTLAAPATYLQQPFVLWSIYGFYILLFISTFFTASAWVLSLDILYGCQFISTFFTASGWVLSIDVLYAVTTASRRSLSIAFVTFAQHLLGDGPSPYIAGIISDKMRGNDDTHEGHMWSLLHAFFIINGCTVLAFSSFYIIAIIMKRDYRIKEEDERLAKIEYEYNQKNRSQSNTLGKEPSRLSHIDHEDSLDSIQKEDIERF